MSVLFWYGVITLLMQIYCDPKYTQPKQRKQSQ